MLTACCDFALRSYNSNNGLLRANVEALSAGEGVEIVIYISIIEIKRRLQK